MLWGIHSFDQWGVELGKVMANELLPEFKDAVLVTQRMMPPLLGCCLAFVVEAGLRLAWFS